MTKGCKIRTLFDGKVEHIVIEARDKDTTVFVLQLGDDLRQRIDGIVHGTAIRAGMKIAIRPRDVDLHVGKAAQTVDDGRLSGGEHGRVGNHHTVTGQHVCMLGNEGGKVGTADLLFAFDKQLDVDGQ